MRVRAAACTALLAVAALTVGCSSGSTDDKPTATAQPTVTKTVDQAAVRQACVDAVADIPADDSGQVPSEPVPDACKSLSEHDYLNAYMDGIEQGNQQARDDMQACLDDPTCTSYPLP